MFLVFSAFFAKVLNIIYATFCFYMPSVTKKKDEEMIWSGRRGQNFFITFVLREEKKSIIISSREKLVSFSQRFTFHSTLY